MIILIIPIIILAFYVYAISQLKKSHEHSQKWRRDFNQSVIDSHYKQKEQKYQEYIDDLVKWEQDEESIRNGTYEPPYPAEKEGVLIRIKPRWIETPIIGIIGDKP